MSLLEVRGVSRSFAPGVPAVDDVSFALDDGEIFGLLGPSGCGKTTLLRIIAGLEAADAGEVWFNDRNMAGVPPNEREFGMMFQDFALFPHKTVYDNVAFGLRMHRVPPPEIAARVPEMLALVDLGDFGPRSIGQLSGGEQQRVALARALAPRPRLLMLDEPLGALDRALRERLMLDVRAILKRVGVTAIYVTHDQTEAFAICDRLAVMNAGHFEQVGPPQAVYARPATPFVARFLGFPNLVPGRVDDDGRLVTPLGRFTPPEARAPGAEGVLLIKPTAGRVAEQASAAEPHDNAFSGVVTALSFRGRYCQVWVESAGLRLLFEVYGDVAFTQGDRVTVQVDPDELLLY